MTLEYISDGSTWSGEPIDGVRHPRSIEKSWTTEALSEIGLRRREPPPPSPPDEAGVAMIKDDAKRRVVARADQIGELIAGLAPSFEKHSWPDKRAAASAVAAGLTITDDPRIAILEAERQVTGETLADLAAKILANVDLANPANYYAAVGLIAGQRRITLAAIDALTDPATVEEDVAAVMAAAEDEAQALLASLLA